MIKDKIRHLARIYLPVYLFEYGKMKIIYAGYSPIKRFYFARLFLNDNSRYKFKGMFRYSGIPELVDKMNVDMAISEVGNYTMAYFRNTEGNILPVWATIRIAIDRPDEVLFHKNRKVTHFKDIIRRINKHGLSYDVSNDRKLFSLFNEKFYKPYIAGRHGKEAFIEDLKVIWDVHRQPFMLIIREKGEIVGMSFCRISGDTLYLMRVGLKDGNQEYASHGAIGATYYFGVLEGKKRGCKFLDLGGGRAFLNDKLTRYKTGLGAEFEPELLPSKEYLWLWVNRRSSYAREYLEKNPFMYVDRHFRLVKSSAEEASG